MTVIRVSLGDRSYPIYLTDSYRQLPRFLNGLHLDPWGVVISHRSLLARFGRQLLDPLKQAGWHVTTITVPESERAKSYGTAAQVLGTLARQARMHVPVLLALGGGVIGDLTGFIAAVFRRGVPYVQLPTTLLAQVDSSIGGKVGVDLPIAKNLVGAFYQPRLVVHHLGLLNTLPLRQRRSGVAEVIKYGMIADPELFRYLEAHTSACVAGDLRAVRVMVERSCRIKARVVAQDERETTGIRTQLNFGHTLGHALEAATGYRRFTHGEAIAIGMACASHLSATLGMMPRADHQRLIRLLEATGLPTATTQVTRAAIQRALRYDKKFVRGTPRWVLPTRIGRVIVTEEVASSLLWRIIGEHLT